MTFEDKLLMIKAGYTKADIESMEGKPEPEPNTDHVGENKKSDPVTLTWDQLVALINNNAIAKPEAKPEPEPKQATSSAMTPEQYSQLLQAINRNNANIDIPPTNGTAVETMLAGRLKSAFTSAEREVK